MNKLDEILKSGWNVQMSFSGITGLYYIEARHWDHDSIVTDGNTLGEAMNDLYEILENTIK